MDSPVEKRYQGKISLLHTAILQEKHFIKLNYICLLVLYSIPYQMDHIDGKDTKSY
jgi:hypothetical protein